MLQFLILLPILLLGCHGADIAPSSSKPELCTSADEQQVMPCHTELRFFLELLATENGTSIDEIHEMCPYIMYYSPIVDRCYGFHSDKLRETFASIKELCSTVKFLVDEFSDCEKKLKGAQCYQDWKKKRTSFDYFNNKNLTVIDIYEDNNCLEKEITKTCNVRSWEKFRNSMTNVYNVKISPLPRRIIDNKNEFARNMIGLFSDGENCSYTDHQLTMHAQFGAINFGAVLKEINVANQTDIKLVNENCKLFNNMTRLIDRCNGFGDKNLRAMYLPFKNLCSITNFLDTELARCSQDIERNKYREESVKCFKDWRQKRISYEYIVQEEKNRNICKDYFGEGNCLKKAVSQLCGSGYWADLRDHLLGLKEGTNDCDFKGLI